MLFCGVNAIYNEISNKYYNIKKEVKNIIKNCELCSIRTTIVQVIQIQPIIIVKKLDRLQIDITYMLDYANSNNNFKYILNIIDCAQICMVIPLLKSNCR
ncbi:hypothetical protein SLOPH_223 [Spraguea lophii 42_110]|uniref:Integrase zinc-binding domain-containing protein n=1 Tax=Spraguea lophii (strain 42_110) TaxID=1358809 RepID=S7W686_SPRLO|nr:hypothetical protein SLOPH_223 [Spraguea lophii 42_110]